MEVMQQIQQILEPEISSKVRSIQRFEDSGNLDAAAREDAVREGITWALFVLQTRLKV